MNLKNVSDIAVTQNDSLEPKKLPTDKESLIELYNKLKSELWRLPPPPPQKQNQPAPPWTPTRLLKRRKIQNKRMGFLIQTLEKEYEDRLAAAWPRTMVDVGMVVQLDMVVPENKGKEQSFRGLCVRRHKKGPRTHFVLVNYFKGSGRIRRLFQFYSPNITNITILSQRPVLWRGSYYTYIMKKPMSYFQIE
eukprot:TRINITY_DN32801_c0_g1_i1.p3 TRINITY_DN32801_c0_g1~~TRINITY_DN32801_c0_g1_i1.p3  ORF type:complete len:192 (+),score=13.29 TRINITY_DN32801_c0_g1_i1:105-680(+)